MLVLSRKLGEKIYIGDNICITVVDIDRGKIRLGIEAPRDVPIYRQELLPLAAQQQVGGGHRSRNYRPLRDGHADRRSGSPPPSDRGLWGASLVQRLGGGLRMAKAPHFHFPAQMAST